MAQSGDEHFKLFLTIAAALAIMAAAVALSPLVLIIGVIWGGYKIYTAYLNSPAQLAKAEREKTAYLIAHPPPVPFPDEDTFVRNVLRDHSEVKRSGDYPAYPLLLALHDVVSNLYTEEGLHRLPTPPAVLDGIEGARYRDAVNDRLKKTVDVPRTLALMQKTLMDCLLDFEKSLPKAATQPARILARYFDDDPPTITLTVPLIDLLGHPGPAIEALALPFFAEDVIELGLYRMLRERLRKNQEEMSGNSGLVMPSDHRGTPREIVEGYLNGTPFIELLETRVPFSVPDQIRFAGHWIIAPPGRGKTTLLHSMLMEDFEKDAAVIVMDSKGDLIEPIRNLKTLEDRYIIVDPDAAHPIAMNPLDIPKTDASLAVANLEYIFSSLLESKLTPLQTTLFRSVLRALITSFPNPTLETFRDILTNGIKKYDEHIRKLPQDLQDFFFKEFHTKTYEDRKPEIIWRLRLLLENDIIRAMLLADRMKFDMAEAMDSGKVVIINNSKARLGDQGAEFFGRLFIAQVLAAAQARSGRKAEDKKPVYFYIDECHNVISRDERIPTILDECRSQKIALIMAHQRTNQITSENVKSALANCGVRYANSDDEAKALAPSLRTTTTFLQSLRTGQFAAFVRDMTPQAVALNITPVDFGAAPKVTTEEAGALNARMWQRYGADARRQPTPPAEPEIPAPTISEQAIRARDERKTKKPESPPSADDGSKAGTTW